MYRQTYRYAWTKKNIPEESGAENEESAIWDGGRGSSNRLRGGNRLPASPPALQAVGSADTRSASNRSVTSCEEEQGNTAEGEAEDEEMETGSVGVGGNTDTRGGQARMGDITGEQTNVPPGEEGRGRMGEVGERGCEESGELGAIVSTRRSRSSEEESPASADARSLLEGSRTVGTVERANGTHAADEAEGAGDMDGGSRGGGGGEAEEVEAEEEETVRACTRRGTHA
jgi:hypothetical protein